MADVPAWWSRETPDPGPQMVRVAQALDAAPEESMRADLHISHARMFEGSPLSSLYQFGGKYWGGGGNTYSTFNLNDVSTWNVLRSVCMTAHAMIGRNRPRARFVTTGGDYRQKRRGRNATKFCDGWAQETRLYDLTRQALVDSMVFDFGAIQLYEDGKGKRGQRLKAQRILASEIRVDPIDALYGKPRTMYRRRFIGRDVLINLFPNSRSAIMAAQTVDPLGLGLDQNHAGMVEVHEAWHLPSQSGGADGRHVIALDKLAEALADEPYKRDRWPIVFLRWEDAISGFGGRSLVSQLAPKQAQLNILLSRTDRAQALMAIPRVAIQKGSKISKSQLSNLIGAIVEYTTQPPTPLVWPAMPPEIYAFIDRIIQEMFDEVGISRQASAGQKDASVKSGAAIRESLDVQQGRIQVPTQRWEEFHVELFDLAIEMIGEIAGDKGYQVAAPGKQALDLVDFKDVRMDRDSYVLQVWPTSQLPITPQGRLDYAQDMLAAGLWDIDRAKQAIEDLDVEGANSLELAVARQLERSFEDALYDGKPCHPDELTPFAQALKLGAMYVHMGRNDGCPAKHIDLMLRYLEELKTLQSKPPAPPAPPMPAPGGMPMPGAPPPGPLGAPPMPMG